MGYIKHNTIIVTGWLGKDLEAVHSKAKDFFKKKFSEENRNGDRLVSSICHGLTNDHNSFFIAPDGSKEGWSTSKLGDEAREEFLDWLMKSKYHCDYLEIRFGGDDENETIIRSNEIDY